jgi:DNA-directed RNA polymerase subunit RPC12/RpoP
MHDSDHCSQCGRPSLDAGIESAHYTSEGVVRYRHCPCGHRWIELLRLTPAR